MKSEIRVSDDQIMVKVPFWLQMGIFSLYPHMAEKTREQSEVPLLRSFNPLMRASPYDLIISQKPPPFGAEISTYEYWRYTYEFGGIWEKHKHLTLNSMINLCHNLSFHYFLQHPSPSSCLKMPKGLGKRLQRGQDKPSGSISHWKWYHPIPKRAELGVFNIL